MRDIQGAADTEVLDMADDASSDEDTGQVVDEYEIILVVHLSLLA